MTESNDFYKLKELPHDVQGEVIREGELRLKAQLQQAIASDQRAMSWLSLVTGTATVSLGAGIGLILSLRSPIIALLILAFAIAMFISAQRAIDAVRPTKFCFPGNEPKNWLPHKWDEGTARDLPQARVEQARCLQNQIKDNIDWAAKSAENLRASMAIALWSIVTSAIFLFGYIGWSFIRP